ncbi:hypothetical protein V5799_008106 [Amblyomma americanum]|uniref:Uncharacterized protein n=1 Tax=Amblyomma americanum TaxID=6943 RepID=A0AAQ4FEA9_AMBAM
MQAASRVASTISEISRVSDMPVLQYVALFVFVSCRSLLKISFAEENQAYSQEECFMLEEQPVWTTAAKLHR